VIAASSLAFLHAVRPAVSGGEGWKQAGELGLALVLSAAIGLERENRQKHAGLRTHTLVGVGAALFMLISKYGFNDVLRTGRSFWTLRGSPPRLSREPVSWALA
jgi:putative Mg2+ transporter-C (MgtC) family protein